MLIKIQKINEKLKHLENEENNLKIKKKKLNSKTNKLKQKQIALNKDTENQNDEQISRDQQILHQKQTLNMLKINTFKIQNGIKQYFLDKKEKKQCYECKECGMLQKVGNVILDETEGYFFCFKCWKEMNEHKNNEYYYHIDDDSNNIKLYEREQEINECYECGELREGNIDINDGLFYCFQCWKLVEPTNDILYPINDIMENNDESNIKLYERTEQQINECDGCGELREGNFDSNDGLFYCFESCQQFEALNDALYPIVDIIEYNDCDDCKYIDYDEQIHCDEKYDAECKTNDNSMILGHKKIMDFDIECISYQSRSTEVNDEYDLFWQRFERTFLKLLNRKQYTMIKKGIENMISTTMMSTEIKNVALNHIDLLDKIDKLHYEQISESNQICKYYKKFHRMQLNHQLLHLDYDCDLKSENEQQPQIQKCCKRSYIEQEMALLDKNDGICDEHNIIPLCHHHHHHHHHHHQHHYHHNMQFVEREEKHNHRHHLPQHCHHHHNDNIMQFAETEENEYGIDEIKKLLIKRKENIKHLERMKENATKKLQQMYRLEVSTTIHSIHHDEFDKDTVELMVCDEIKIDKHEMSDFCKTKPFHRWTKKKLKIHLFEFKISLYPNNKGMVQYFVKLKKIPMDIKSVVIYFELYCNQTDRKYMITKQFYQNQQQTFIGWHNHLSFQHCKQYNHMEFKCDIQILRINRFYAENGMITTDHSRSDYLVGNDWCFHVDKHMLSTIKYSKTMTNIWYIPIGQTICYSLESFINGNQKEINLSVNLLKFPSKIEKYDITFSLRIKHKKLNVKQSKNCEMHYDATQCKIKLNKKEIESLLSLKLTQNQTLYIVFEFYVNKIWIRGYPNTPHETKKNCDCNGNKHKQKQKRKQLKQQKKTIKKKGRNKYGNNKRKKKNKKFKIKARKQNSNKMSDKI